MPKAIAACLALALSFGTVTHAQAACMRGVNLSGAEFGDLKGAYGQSYIYPSDAMIAYFKAKGLNTIRLPFLWERLQPILGRDLDPAELERLKDAVTRMRAAGLMVVLDPHNYAVYNGNQIGSNIVSDGDFASFWKKLATVFANQDGVSFGLMNEPHDLPSERWLTSANSAIAAIRAAGAGNLILVPGTSWTGAHSWQEANAANMIKVQDPGNNFAFEVHQYLDSDFSGTHATCERAQDAATAIDAMTSWLKANGKRGFLGEFGGGNSPGCIAGLKGMVARVNAASDVWVGWTYWVAGDWWPPSEPLNITPTKDGDRPQLATLLGPGLSDKSCAGL